jgi:hypothetical protein
MGCERASELAYSEEVAQHAEMEKKRPECSLVMGQQAELASKMELKRLFRM